ncbi:hypothetical protein BGZ99_002059 [Dissophora globulifera]|uniref:Uncharacterized protein n=1 Tax=Dissophora globulifera TaxID=979702 RepID=A0A9P6RSU2_9FUNG|nr:hypothetical protein BGZ99_002059 [Dissophora globulifera]
MSLLKRTAALSLSVSRRYASTVTKSATATSSTTASTAAGDDAPGTSSAELPRKRESLDPAKNRDKFLTGNPHPISNLRPVLYPIPPNESPEDREFRERRERVDAFNQDFWVSNNNMFNKAKADYEEKIRAQNGNQPVTTEELSVFYKDFLDRAYDRQMRYNRQWWVENVGMLLPAAKAAVRKWTSRSS